MSDCPYHAAVHDLGEALALALIAFGARCECVSTHLIAAGCDAGRPLIEGSATTLVKAANACRVATESLEEALGGSYHVNQEKRN